MNRFVDEEYHMWKDFEFCITDDDIKKLKQGKILYSDVDEEYTIILKYYEKEKKKALEQEPVLGKIRAEIIEVYNDRPSSYNHTQRKELFCKVIEIIDKYKE